MIKGIDSQVMMQRTVEFSRQTSEQMGSVQQGQDFLRKLEQEKTTQNARTVGESEKAEQKRIRDEEERKRREDEEKKKKKEEKPQEKKRPILDDVSQLQVGYAPVRRLDIEI